MDHSQLVTAYGSFIWVVNYSTTKEMAIGESITSPKFRVGGYDWMIKYFPRGNILMGNGGNHVSVFLEHQRESTDVTAMFDVQLEDKDGKLTPNSNKHLMHTFTALEQSQGWPCFLERNDLEQAYVKNGSFVLLCKVVVKNPSTGQISCNEKLEMFYQEENHADVSFGVDRETFLAHRLILALHSPVFEAELYGSMVQSDMEHITIREMDPSVFEAMIDFMYNGLVQIDSMEIKYPVHEFLEKLLAAADRYGVKKLQLTCEHKLMELISGNTIIRFLVFAEKHKCVELKRECLKFMADKVNWTTLMFDHEYLGLLGNRPDLLAEVEMLATGKGN